MPQSPIAFAQGYLWRPAEKGKVVQYFPNETQNPCSAGDGVEVMRFMDALLND